ncbi:MAG: nitrous oxide reductase accessory protein NosL [Chloroflexi bacterium]|nr:nitrous oxide reductase accessory protein NosL [Chloroflexota bacterium]
MATRRRFLVLLGGGTVVAAAAVGGYILLPGEETASGLPKIKYGRDTCVQCTMIISDTRFAAAWREQGGIERHFDDVGCMVAYFRKHSPGSATLYWVRDFEHDAWLDAQTAAYAVAAGVKSPMGYGVAAFASAPAAAGVVQRYSGEAATWTSLVDNLKERG